MIDARDAYLNDSTFSTLVDMMYQMLKEGQASVVDLRAAAMFAATKYAMENPAAIHLKDYCHCVGKIEVSAIGQCMRCWKEVK